MGFCDNVLTLRFCILVCMSIGIFTFFAQRASFATNLLCILDDPLLNKTLTTKLQGQLHGIFFISYAIFQIPISILISKFGARYVVGFFNTLFSLNTILIPFFVPMDIRFFLAMRFLSGLGASCWFPGVYHLIPKWVPNIELSFSQVVVFTGMNIGSILSPVLTDRMCNTTYTWRAPFFIWGSIGLGFSLLWLIFISESPLEHKLISKKELDYLKGEIVLFKQKKKKNIRSQLNKLFKCAPLYAYAACHFSCDWSAYFLITQIPNFLKNVMKFDRETNSKIQGALFIGFWAGQFVFAGITTILQKKGLVKLVNLRKLMCFIGYMLPATCILLTCPLTEEYKYIAVFLLFLIIFTASAAYFGPYLTPMDLVPSHSGNVVAVVNAVAASSGYIVASLTSHLVDAYGHNGWICMMIISASLNIISGTFYLVFAKADLLMSDDDEVEQEMVKKPFMSIDEKSS